MAYVETSVKMQSAPDLIYGIAKDMENYPKFMSDVESVTVIERSPVGTITEWVTSVEGIPIRWREVDTFDDQALRIDYRLIEGDLDKFEGAWIIEPHGNETMVTLTVDFDFGMPTLAELLGPILDMKVRENSRMMLEGMKQQVESMKQKAEPR